MNKKFDSSALLSHAIFILFSIACVLPMILLISSSFTSEVEYIREGISIIPKNPVTDGYKVVLKFPQQIIKAYGVSFFTTIVGTLVSLLITAMVAYPLSKRDYKYGRAMSFYLYFTMLFSGGLAPFYILVSKYLHLNDTVWVYILPSMAGPGIIFMMRTFFASVPKSLFEAAKIDGASEFKIFRTILIPLSPTAIATAGFMILLGYWNEWYNGMLFITNKDLYTLPLVLKNMTEFLNMARQTPQLAESIGLSTIPQMSVQSALCVLTVMPMLLVFTGFQKYFIQGITAGAVKE